MNMPNAQEPQRTSFQAEIGEFPYLNASWVTPTELRITCSRPDKAKAFEDFLLNAGVGIFTMHGHEYTGEPGASLAGKVVDAEFVPPKPHKHAAIIKAWANDTTQRIWFYDPTDRTPQWAEFKFGANAPAWRLEVSYALGDKPTAPPADWRATLYPLKTNTMPARGSVSINWRTCPFTAPGISGRFVTVPSYIITPEEC